MKTVTQYDLIERELKRAKSRGRSSLELTRVTNSTSPHKRVQEMIDSGKPIVRDWRKQDNAKDLRIYRWVP